MILVLSTLIVAVCFAGLFDSVEGKTDNLGISEHFISVILLPLFGNVADRLTAVDVAMKDLPLGVALASSSQLATLVVPFNVIAGWVIGVPMDLNFRPRGAGILLLTMPIVGSLTSDGESGWLEGTMLTAAYIMIAITFWVLWPTFAFMDNLNKEPLMSRCQGSLFSTFQYGRF